MELIDIPTEQTTAATDLVLAILAAACAVYLCRIGRLNVYRRNLWSWVFGLLAVSAAIGAVAHGFRMSPEVNNLLWQPLNLLLGLTVAMFAVGAVYDTWGRRIAQRLLPVMMAIGVFFYGVTVMLPDSTPSDGFLAFIVYETVVMLFALGTYCTLAVRGRLDGAGLIAAAILITIAAAAVQATGTLHFTLIWEFNHDGIFHLMQMPGVILLAAGVGAAMHAKDKDTLCRG
jgi:hypothetical protein